MTTYPSAEKAIAELLYTAYRFDDKPHKLFACIEKIARQYADVDYKDDIIRAMEQAYREIGNAPVVWYQPLEE